ncbi:hypothetical protein GCM10022253_14400 [Sphingomonas endophytica]|uniref:Uncharacterized protein n=1 Tax=Sphingomonas endophytica TaxID=869719 RepID=A0ABR6N7P9_9SPHN|nr:hypothetical protein [Sphingomonas endophytica]MBB5725787.1 hypothetical protein [Sphingomonas endophytica]
MLVDPTSTTSIAFKSGYSYDGTHLTNIGARAAGNDFAAWAATQIGGTVVDLLALNASTLATNGRFTTATGGSTVTGISGSVPASWGANKGGTPTANVSTGPAPDGVGNEFIAAITSTANSDRLLFSQQITTGLAMGDKVRLAAEIAVDAGSVNLRSVRAYATAWFDGVTVNVVKFDMQPIAAHLNGSSGAYVNLLSPDILTLTRSGSTTFDRLDIAFAAEFRGPGSATIRIRKVVVVKV